MATYETELLARVVALQKEAMTSINVRADAVPTSPTGSRPMP
jgi:hypothetical protein